MGTWHRVIESERLKPGGFAVAETDELLVAVFNVAGSYYAIEDICTHDGEELTGGPIEGDQIICPRHGARFCIRTGKALTPPAYEDVRTFAVRVCDGLVEVELPAE